MSVPGGGAEILEDGVRKRIVALAKAPTERWAEVHREAHRLGMPTTATMMFGVGETYAERVAHLDVVRSVQDASLEAGKESFTAFIPWSFKPDHTVLERRHPERTGPVPYLRVLAASRVYLDNFDHIQASWFSEGKKAGQASLHFGADDFGGTLMDENVHAAAGFVNKAGVDEVKTLVREAGFAPVQRTTLYERVPA